MSDMEISVIIPTYNRAALLSRALEGVRAQTMGDYEVIVVDDGSTDDTAVVLTEWRAVFQDRLRVIAAAHQGVAAARNRGMAESRGRRIAFLDSDDEWLPTHLETGLAAFGPGAEVGLVFTDHFIQSDKRVRTRAHLSNEPRRAARQIVLREVILATPAVFLDRRVFEALGGFNESLRGTEDWEYWGRVALRYPVRHAPEATAVIYQHAENHSGNPQKAKTQLLAAAAAISADPALAGVCAEGEVRARACLDSAEYFSLNRDRGNTLAQWRQAVQANPRYLFARDTLRILGRLVLPRGLYLILRNEVWRRLSGNRPA